MDGKENERGEPACIHQRVGVIVAGRLDVFRRSEYGLNFVPAGNDIMGSAAPVINPSWIPLTLLAFAAGSAAIKWILAE